jgi:hypothetical protein
MTTVAVPPVRTGALIIVASGALSTAATAWSCS